MVRVIATDLDGTLLNPKKKFSLVEKSYRKYIKNFYGDVVLVSGRNPKFCAKICNKLKIHHNFIALNGAVIVKEGNIIYSQSMKKTALSSMMEFIESYYSSYEILIFDKYDRITCYSTDPTFKAKTKHFKHAIKNGKLHDKITVSNKKAKEIINSSTDIYKIIVYSDYCEDVCNLLKKSYKSHFSFFPNKHSIEIAPFGVSKGAALEYLINTTKVNKNEVYVVGDSTNDISMFEKFENSFVMNTANTNVKSKAKHSIDKFSDLIEYTKLNNNFSEENNELL